MPKNKRNKILFYYTEWTLQQEIMYQEKLTWDEWILTIPVEAWIILN